MAFKHACYYSLTLITVLFSGRGSAQVKEKVPDIYNCTHCGWEIDDLADLAAEGDMASLKSLARYLTDDTLYLQSCGPHSCNFLTTVSLHVESLIANLVPFLHSDIDLYPENGLALKEKLKLNFPKLYYDTVTRYFLRDDSEKKTFDYAMFLLPDSVMARLRNKKTPLEYLKYQYGAYFSLDSVKSAFNTLKTQQHFEWEEGLLTNKDPRILAEVAKGATERPHNVEYYHSPEAIEFITKYTGLVLIQKGRGNNTGWEYYNNNDYFNYWKVHYRDYKWEGAKKRFVNTKVPAIVPDLSTVFNEEMIRGPIIPKGYFMQITESPPELISYYLFLMYLNKEKWDKLPLQFKYLQLLSELSNYCRENDLNYKWNPAQEALWSNLCNSQLTLSKRHSIEDSLLQFSSLEDITPLEYLALTENRGMNYGSHSEAGISTGKALNTLYLAHWKDIVSDKKQLSLYLYKYALFNKIAQENCLYYTYGNIIRDSDAFVTRQLREIYRETPDEAIKKAIGEIILKRYEYKSNLLCIARRERWNNQPKEWGKWRFAKKISRYGIKLADEYHADNKYPVKNLIIQADYDEVKDVLDLLGSDKAEYFSALNYLLTRHLGIPIDEIKTEADFNTFSGLYHSKTELELYDYYLRKAGYTCTDSLGGPNLDKIYELVTHNFITNDYDVDATGVYAAIKLLEGHFGTTLGYPEVNIWSDGLQTEDVFERDRCNDWIRYLEQNKLVKAQYPHSLFSNRILNRTYEEINDHRR